MGKSFPDPSDFAYHPPVKEIGDASPSVDAVKVVPAVPGWQSNRPQLRPIVNTD